MSKHETIVQYVKVVLGILALVLFLGLVNDVAEIKDILIYITQ